MAFCRLKYECIMYIHERDNWTNFRWDISQVSLLQEKVFRKQGLLYGRLSSLGFDSKLRAMAENLTYDVVYSSEIEGIRLNVDQVPFFHCQKAWDRERGIYCTFALC